MRPYDRYLMQKAAIISSNLSGGGGTNKLQHPTGPHAEAAGFAPPKPAVVASVPVQHLDVDPLSGIMSKMHELRSTGSGLARFLHGG